MNEFNQSSGKELVQAGSTKLDLPGQFGEETALAVSLARAEVDQQITTAKRYPRNIQRVADEIMSMVCLDDETAKECIYALPRDGKAIRGPSIRMAEIIAALWGNCRVATRITHVDRFEKYVEAEGTFHDLQTNTATKATVQRRISDKHGRLFSPDMIIVTANAACSIAKRNAILAGVPKPIWRAAQLRVEKVIRGDAKTMTERRDEAMKAFAAFGVTPERVCAAIGRTSTADITLDDVVDLVSMHAQLRNGESDPEELFPLIKKPQAAAAEEERPTTLKGKLEHIAAGNGNGDGNGKPAQQTQETQNKQQEEEEEGEERHDPETGEVRNEKPQGEAAQGSKRPGRPPGSKNKAKDHAVDQQPQVGQQTAEKTPDDGSHIKTAPEYVGHASTWIGKITSAVEARKRWADERVIRNRIGLDPDIRNALEASLAAMCKSAPDYGTSTATTAAGGETKPQQEQQQAGRPAGPTATISEAIEAASKSGESAYYAGAPREAPQEMRTPHRINEAQAWYSGYDSAKNADMPE